jgi:hypothetical protein
MIKFKEIFDNDDFYECMKCGSSIDICTDVCDVCGHDHNAGDERVVH